MTDSDLKAAVQQELDWEPSIDAGEIGVFASNSVVSLTGHVESYPQKHRAEEVAVRVRGVHALVSQLEVRLPGGDVRSDEEIARAAANAIAWNTLLPKEEIKVRVEKGRVTLEGAVDWHYQRASAAEGVRYLTGVKDVNNHIVVNPRVRREVVKSDIEAALLRNAEVEAHNIRVETRGDHVILWGNVRSWSEREEAERAAWASPGVCHVDNHITVNAAVPALR
jgi:osmotically-inducible protein OsmY